MRGVYTVFFRLEQEACIEVGALGEREFEPGIYVYVGSAMNGVESRIQRHFSDQKKLHWHIDYFSRVANTVDYFILPEKSKYECILAAIVSQFAESIDDFGCSDCDCDSHLFFMESW